MKLSQWLNKKNRAEENKRIKIVRNSDMFDERWYVSQYQDVFKKLKDPARHYYQKGWKENRNPSENFNTAGYLRRYPECEVCPIIFEHNRNGYVDLSVCAIMKNEAPYVKEWLDYHLSVGVKRFYIYDNESTDNLKKVLAPYIGQGIVVYKYYPGEAKQMPAYNECIREYRDKTEWLAVIDADEFIMPTEKDSIPEFLKEFKDCPGVGINWICYDSDGHKKKPKGAVMENYTRVHYDEQFSSNHHIKSIVRPSMVETYVNPYYAQYIGGKNAVDENGKEIKGCVYRDTHPKAFTDVVSVNKIRVNHYYCKSEEEYVAKLERGRALTRDDKKQFSARSLIFEDTKYDYTAYKYVEDLHPELAQKLRTKALWFELVNIFTKLKHSFGPNCLFDYIDEEWYFAKYPEAKASGMSALQHYLSIGWKEGKNPSKYFDTDFYLNRYSDIAKAGINPLLHYINFGRSVGRLPRAEMKFFSDNTEELRIIISKVDPLSRDYQLLDNSDLFDKQWYTKTYLKRLENIDPVAHYMSLGWKSGCNPSKEFDTEFYLKKYKDVAKSGQNPLLHYLKHGMEEGRLPKFSGGLFKRLWRRINGTEFENDTFVSPHEVTEGYSIVESSELFDRKWYSKKYLRGKKVNPVEHYLTIGWKSGNNPSAEFSTAEYLQQHPECEVCPLVFEYNRNRFVDLAICAIMKNEGPYVKEWIDYHRLVGVKRFYIYDNVSTDNMKEVLAPYIAEGVVVYEFVPDDAKQRGVYNSCLKCHGDEMHWLAFIDTDEFIVPKEKDSVPEFLEDYEDYSGVSMNWINFDSNGHKKMPKGGVLKNYSKVYYDDESWRNHNVKTIVKPKDVQTYFVHQGRYRDGKYAVDENKNKVWGEKYLPYVSVNKIQINHYFCKSEEEAAAKEIRGRLSLKDIGNGKTFKIKPWEIDFEEYKYDYNIYKYLIRLNPEIARRLKIKRLWLKFLNSIINIRYLFKKDALSKYVDEKWYFTQYPEAKYSGLSARRHYIQIGWMRGYNPSDKFNTDFYLQKYPAVAEFQICPLIHYVSRGIYEEREILPTSDFEKIIHDNSDYVDLSVCTIMKNEAPYVKEWLDYHLSVGVKRFYIYDNESTDNLKEMLDPYIARGVVVYKYYPGEAKQMPAYNECISEYKDKTEWLAVIDADEFIVPVEKDGIPEFLKEFKNCPGVGINWICYDSNGYKKKPEGGLMENYTRVHYDEQFSSNHHIKSIVRPSMVDTYTNPHYAQYIGGKNAVDENGKEIKGCVYRDTHPKAFTDVVSVNKIRINHYYCKSEEEYRAKLARGRAPMKGAKKTFSIRSLIFDDAKYDYTAYKYAKRLYPNLAQKLKIKTLWLEIMNVFTKLKHSFGPSCLFDYIDEEWYFAKYPEAKASGMSALQHYLSTGWKEGKNPSKYFDTDFYLERYKDIARAEINPLLHYITVGKEAGRLPKAKWKLFEDKNDEQQKVADTNQEETAEDTLAKKTNYELVDNSELLDKKWYIKTYLKGQDNIDPIKHYLKFGWRNGFNPSKNFNTEFYLKEYKDVAKTGRNPLLHYLKHGMEEGRLSKSPYSWLFGWWQNIFLRKEQFISEYGVTVIMPTYNRKEYLKKALDMLKSQTLNSIKFIVVDDGSTDGSADYIEEAIKDDKRFTFIRNTQNQGPSVARNKALNLVKTVYVGFFDVDDEIPQDYFEALYLQASNNLADIVYTNYNKEQHRIKKIAGEADKYRALRNGAIWDKLYSTALLKKNKIKFAEHLYTADNLFNIEAFHAANRIVLVDEPCYSYELHKDSIGKDEKLVAKRKKDIISICNKAIDFAKNNDFDVATCVGLCDFLKRTYDCYAEDTDFHKKLASVLKKTGINVNVATASYKYNKQEYDMVKQSEYFDAFYYICHTPQLWFSCYINPVEHYLTVGWLEGKNPSAKFDGNKYFNLNPDVAVSGMNPLLHYLKHGKEENRSYEEVDSIGEKIKYALTYPVRVKEEYDCLLAEIKALESMK